MTAQRKVEVVVFADTSVIHCKNPTEVFNKRFRDEVAASKADTSATIHWYVADVTLRERAHQMQQALQPLLNTAKRLEELIEHDLGTSNVNLYNVVNKRIRRSVDELGVNVVPLDVAKAFWNEMIHAAVTRLPPFEEPQEEAPQDKSKEASSPKKPRTVKEKGFRDALIMETYAQVVAQGTAYDRCIFVAEDNRLREAVSERVGTAANSEEFETVQEALAYVRFLHSPLGDTVDMEKVQRAANDLFRSDLINHFHGMVVEDYGSDFYLMDFSSQDTNKKIIKVELPQFQRLADGRIYWRTEVQVAMNILRHRAPPNPPMPKMWTGGMEFEGERASAYQAELALYQQKPIQEGQHVLTFSVFWNCAIDVDEDFKLGDPQYEAEHIINKEVLLWD